MTQRGASASVITELASATNAPFHLFEVAWDSGTIYLTDAASSITWSGNTYSALGKMLGFGNIEESVALQATGVDLTLSGVPTDLVSSFLAEDFIDRQVKIYKGFFNSGGAVISDPVLVFQGLMDSPDFQEVLEENATVITIPANSQWAQFDKVNGRKTNTNSQRLHFSGDKGFNFVPGLKDKAIEWGD